MLVDNQSVSNESEEKREKPSIMMVPGKSVTQETSEAPQRSQTSRVRGQGVSAESGEGGWMGVDWDEWKSFQVGLFCDNNIHTIIINLI